MSYRDYCGFCGESYDDENLETCRTCHRSFCYRCGDFREKRCLRCSEAERAAATRPPLRSEKDAGQGDAK